MRFVVAGGGVAGLAAALALARAGHDAVVLERDVVDPGAAPLDVFDVERRGIPHYLQPHTFLPRGRRLSSEWAPDVLDALVEAGADPQDLAAESTARASRPVRGDVVVDALGRYRCPPGWPRAAGEPTDSGAIYYCRYFEPAAGVEHLDAQILNPRGDLGYMGFNTFRGDNRTYSVILLAPAADHDLRVLRHDAVWRAACAQITPLDVMTSADYGRPITGVMPMGGLMNVDRTGEPGVAGIVATGDGFCHTDPAFAYGLSFSLAHAQALARATAEAPDADAIVERFRRQPAPRRASATRLPARPTRRARGAGRVSRWTSRAATASMRSSRSWAPWQPRRMTTRSCAPRSAGSVSLTAPPSSTRTNALHDRIEGIFAGLARRRRRPAARRAAGAHRGDGVMLNSRAGRGSTRASCRPRSSRSRGRGRAARTRCPCSAWRADRCR